MVPVDILLARLNSSEHSHLPKHHESPIKAEHLGQCWRLGTQSRNFTFAPQHFSSTGVSKNEPMSFNCTGKKKKKRKKKKRTGQHHFNVTVSVWRWFRNSVSAPQLHRSPSHVLGKLCMFLACTRAKLTQVKKACCVALDPRTTTFAAPRDIFR